MKRMRGDTRYDTQPRTYPDTRPGIGRATAQNHPLSCCLGEAGGVRGKVRGRALPMFCRSWKRPVRQSWKGTGT